jgi:hypothetical protein
MGRKMLYTSSYATTREPEWQDDDSVLFYRHAQRKIAGMPPLESDQWIYSEKIIWKGGEEKRTKEYIKSYSE